MGASFAIETNLLNRSFGKVQAVKDLSLEVPDGAVYGFLGANGAGKTTTIRILMGILPATSGTIGICGENGPKVSLQQRQKLSYVSQEQYFYPWMKSKELGSFVSGFYRTWNQTDFINLMDLFQIPANRRVDELSGGMRTKLALALSLASCPKVLILDEPTTGLDPIARREFMNLVLDCARTEGRTVFFSSHLVNEVERFADHAGIINDGQLQFQGSLEEIYSNIRRVTFSREVTPPKPCDQFEIWQSVEHEDKTISQVIRSSGADWWQANCQSPDYQVETLSLEDVFLASAGQLRAA